MENTKEYTRENLTVIWKPGKCVHAGVCVKTLPKVYKPKATPWISCENASVEDLKSQIDACPSGALTYRVS